MTLQFLLVIFFFQCCEACSKIDRYCNCDKNCVDYGDCCPGHEMFNRTGSLRDILSCKNLSDTSEKTMWIIDKCRNPNHRLSSLCTKPMSQFLVPIKSFVPVITKERLIFRNKFCAYCNGEIEFTFVKVSISCSDLEITGVQDVVNNLKSIHENCSIEPIIKSSNQRLCHKKFIRFCPKDFQESDIKKSCAKGDETEMVTGDDSYYRNIFCCQCWNVNCTPRIVPSINGKNPKLTVFYLLDFNDWHDDIEMGSEFPIHSSNDSNSTEYNLVDDFVFYTSFAFTIFSMICLLYLIVLYTTQKIFYNFGGYLTVCLGGSLWIMDFFTLLVSNSYVTQSKFCLYLSIFQHFISLSTFAWMSVYALDLLQTFGMNSSQIGDKKTFKTFITYCCVIFSCVGLIVGTSVVLEFTLDQNSTIIPKYGGSNCWFTNKVGGIIWYFLPVCLLLCWNFGACFIVFYRLIKTARECQFLQKNDINATLWLCLRLTTVFGIGYSFEVFAVLTSVKFLITIASLINCLQGCLLTICFLWTQRARKLVINLYSSFKHRFSKSYQSSTEFNKRPSFGSAIGGSTINKK